MSDRVWITWETQRRSIELARKFGCKLYVIERDDLFRYPFSFFKTLYIFIKERPKLLFVQNPSMFLSALACIWGKLSKTTVVVDRHTTFRLNKPHSGSFSIWLFMRLHYFTLKWADLTIVTNDFLANLVIKAQGTPFVLPDMLPDISKKSNVDVSCKFNILLISSFGLDEPVIEAMEAIKSFKGNDVCLYISGNYTKLDPNLPKTSPSNIKFTGFLPDQDFIDLLFSVDAAMALTTSDYCMLCGCYEAISAEKPLITSNKIVLKDYFSKAFFVESSVDSIKKGIKTLIDNKVFYENSSKTMKSELNEKWHERYLTLESELERLISPYHSE